MALRLRGATSGYIELKAPASAGDNTLTLPTNNGSANQLLKTDGSGNLSWTDDNSGVSLSGSTDNTLVTVTGANALQGESVLTFDGNDLQVRPAKANFIVAKSGLTVKANSALHTSYDLIQLGAGGALASYSTATATADTQFIHNAYRSSGGSWKYRYADTAARLRVNSPARTWVFESAVSGSADGDISFIEQLRITSTGQLQATSAADVRFTLGSSGTAGTNDSVHIRADSADLKFMAASSGSTIFEVNGTETLRIKSTGEVGIGTSTPGQKLGVAGNIRFEAGDPTLEFNNGGAMIYARVANTLQFASGGGPASPTEKMRIDASGRLLIGQTSSTSSSKLCVHGAVGTAEAFFELNRTDDPANNQNIGVIEFSQGSAASRLAARLMTRRDGGVWGASSLPTRFEFHTCVSGSNTTAERVRITSNGNLNILDGDLTIGTSGHGIDFSATAGTGTSELLDDYEEGSFTPKLGGTSNSSTYHVDGTGTYIKIGRKITVSIRFQAVDLDNNAAGTAKIYNMPFGADHAPSNGVAGITNDVQYYNVTLPDKFGNWYISGSTTAWVGLVSRNNNTWDNWSIDNFEATTTYMNFTGTYFTN